MEPINSNRVWHKLNQFFTKKKRFTKVLPFLGGIFIIGGSVIFLFGGCILLHLLSIPDMHEISFTGKIQCLQFKNASVNVPANVDIYNRKLDCLAISEFEEFYTFFPPLNGTVCAVEHFFVFSWKTRCQNILNSKEGRYGFEPFFTKKYARLNIVAEFVCPSLVTAFSTCRMEGDKEISKKYLRFGSGFPEWVDFGSLDQDYLYAKANLNSERCK